MNLSPKQSEAFDKIMGWHRGGDQEFVLAGYAGAGKTTLARSIAKEIGMNKTEFAAYTGKAANVLREKGCRNSSTIHGLIYKLVDEDDEKPYFTLNYESDACGAGLVIIDEYSMLPTKIREDLKKLAKKILYLGDPFQLPPVEGECDLKPDFFIDEIHRQALESPIIRYATDVRQGKALEFCDHPEFVYATKKQVPAEAYEEADQIIVGYNDTRKKWNNRFRQKLGFQGHQFPQAGDKLICTKNNHEIGLFNGMIEDISQDALIAHENYFTINFADRKDIKVWNGNFMGNDAPVPPEWRHLNKFDFGYVITCHKSQGSEFDNVLVFEEPIGKGREERARWLYTALTRAKKKVTLVKPS